MANRQQFGCHGRVFRCVLRTTQRGLVVPVGSLINPGFDCELRMKLDRDLPPGSDLDEARAAVGQVYPAPETNETWAPKIQILCAMADNPQQKTCVPAAQTSSGAIA